MPKNNVCLLILTLMDPFAEENMKMTDCYFEKKDWRQCKDEASCHLAISIERQTVR